MSDYDIGNARAGIKFDLAGIKRQLEQSAALMRQANDVMAQNTQAIRAKMEMDAEKMRQRDYAAQVRANARLIREEERKQRAMLKAQEATHKRQAAALRSLGSQVGTASGVGGVVVAAGLADATKTAAQFDQAMRNVDSIAHLTEQQLAALRAEALKLANDKSIRQTPHDLAEGLYQVYSAGKSGKEGLEILEWGAKGASAGMTDTATSTKVLLAVLNSGISGVNNAREAMDVLFQEVNLGVNTFPELANSIGNVLPTAKVVGVSLQEVAAAMAQMTRNGISADESVTALNQLLTHIWKPGKEAEKLMTSLGISFGSAALEGKGLGGWLKEVMEKTHGNRDQLAHLIPEIRGAKGEFSLLSDGLKGYNELLAGMKTASNGAGQTTEALTRQNKGAMAQFELLKKEVDLTKIAIGDALLPKVNEAIGTFRTWLEEWNKQPKSAKDAQTGMALFTAEAGLAIGAVGSMIKWLSGLRTALGLTAGQFGALGVAVAAVTSLIKYQQDLFNEGEKDNAAVQRGNNTPASVWKDKADAIRQKLAYNNEVKKAFESHKSTMPPPLSDYEVKNLKEQYQKLMATQNRMNQSWRGSENPGNAESLAMGPPSSLANKKSPWGKGGYDRDAGKGAAKAAREAAREREQALKDAKRDAEDERKLIEGLIAERKRLNMAGYELAQFNAQQQFNATMRDSKTPASRAAAALLYRDQVRKAREERDLAAREKGGYNDFGDAIEDAIEKAQAKKERALGLLSAGMANSYAQTQYENQMADAIAKEVEAKKRAQDEIMEYRRRMGEITNSDYIKFLQERVEAERRWTMASGSYKLWGISISAKEISEENPEFRAKNLELRQHYAEALESVFGAKGRKGGAEGAREIAEGLSQGNKYLKRAMEDLGGGALGSLQKALRKGMKGTFGDILAHTLTDLLSTVLENAITSAFRKNKKPSAGIFGGGGLLGDFLSPVASLFGGGRAVQPVASSAATRGVNIHIHGDNHFNNTMDVQEFGRTLAWQVQSELNRTVGNG